MKENVHHQTKFLNLYNTLIIIAKKNNTHCVDGTSMSCSKLHYNKLLSRRKVEMNVCTLHQNALKNISKIVIIDIKTS